MSRLIGTVTVLLVVILALPAIADSLQVLVPALAWSLAILVVVKLVLPGGRH